MPAFVRALKRVDLPTLGRPTMPHLRLMEEGLSKAKRARGHALKARFSYTATMNPPRLTLSPHTKDLGGCFLVRRLLPSAARQAVGPFLFFDHFGPIAAGPQDDHDVRPHPHIGLA